MGPVQKQYGTQIFITENPKKLTLFEVRGNDFMGPSIK
jgi:hypothetical protein